MENKTRGKLAGVIIASFLVGGLLVGGLVFGLAKAGKIIPSSPPASSP